MKAIKNNWSNCMKCIKKKLNKTLKNFVMKKLFYYRKYKV